MGKKTKYIVLLAVGIFALGLFSTVADASGGLSVKPAKLDLDLCSGVTVFETFVVTNTTSKSLTVKVPSTFTLYIEGSDVKFEIISGGPSQFTLFSGATRGITYRIIPDSSGAAVKRGKGSIKFSITGVGVNVASELMVPVDVKLVIRKADLIVSDILVYPKPFAEGVPVTLTGIIKNENTSSSADRNNCKDAGPFNVKWYVNGTQVQYKRASGVKSGGQASVILERSSGVRFQGDGTCIVQLKVDVDGEVGEYIETNNEKTKDITETGPDPVEPVFKSGIIRQSEDWSGIIKVTGDVTISTGVTVTVAPGTLIQFARSDDTNSGLDARRSELIVKGTLDAQGTSSEKIIFSSDAVSKTKGDWIGIIADGVQGLDLQYCTIEYADKAINLTLHNSASVSLENNTITESGYGIYCKTADIAGVSSLNILGHNIYNNSADGIYLETSVLKTKCDLSVADTKLYNNNNGIACDAKLLGAINLSVTNNNINDNRATGIWLKRRGAFVKLTLTASHNTIINNKDMGIRCSVSKPAEIHYNSLFDNTKYDLRNYSVASINAQNNYWGEDTTGEMNAGVRNITKIYDHQDSLIRGRVYYSPWSSLERKDATTKSKENVAAVGDKDGVLKDAEVVKGIEKPKVQLKPLKK